MANGSAIRLMSNAGTVSATLYLVAESIAILILDLVEDFKMRKPRIFSELNTSSESLNQAPLLFQASYQFFVQSLSCLASTARRRNRSLQFSLSVNPNLNSVYHVGKRFFSGSTIRHTARQIRNVCGVTATIFVLEGAYDDCVSGNLKISHPASSAARCWSQSLTNCLT